MNRSGHEVPPGSDKNAVVLNPWTGHDMPLLEKIMGDPAMMEHLGGPESSEKIAERQVRYELLASSGKGQMFKIVDTSSGEAVGSVGYWERSQEDTTVYEIGWSVLPRFQGRGVATMATAQAITAARLEGRHQFIYAFPSLDNPASNALCRKLGFMLVETLQFEYPKGNTLECNVWRRELLDDQVSSRQGGNARALSN